MFATRSHGNAFEQKIVLWERIHVWGKIWKMAVLAVKRPLPRCMDQREYPQCLAVDLIDQSVVLVWNQLAGSRYFPGLSQCWMVCQSGCCSTEKCIHPHGCLRVFFRDVVPYVDAILMGLCGPDNIHV